MHKKQEVISWIVSITGVIPFFGLHYRCDGEYEITIYQVGFIPKHLEVNKKQYFRYGLISGQNGDTISYAKQAGEGAFIHSSGMRIHIDTFAHIHTGDGITFAVTEEEGNNLVKLNPKAKQVCTFSAYVEFQLKYSYFNRLHDAICSLPEAVILKLMPTKSSFTKSPLQYAIAKPEYSELELDKTGQLQALNAILTSGSNAPLLVAGPFGTGKTRLLARAAYQILRFSRKARILVCAHHQASADTFMEYFGEMKEKEWPVNVVRIIPNEDYHSSTCEKYEMCYKMKHEVNSSFNLIVTTLGKALHLEGHFTHILMDEGAQTREPEAIAPLCLATEDTKIVIAGDHYQV